MRYLVPIGITLFLLLLMWGLMPTHPCYPYDAGYDLEDCRASQHHVGQLENDE